MPTITFSFNDYKKLLGKDISIDELEEIAYHCKAEVEEYNEEADEVKMEFGDTNLPYLWSIEGFVRFSKGYLGMQKGIPKIKLNKGDYKLIIDKSVSKLRPYISCFAAKGKKLDDYLLKQIIQLQEKFCESYGRRRQKVSIGLYSYAKLKFPVHYKAVDPLSLEFVPLEFKAKMNLKEILAEHPKGKEYSYVLDGFEKYPVLMDDKNEVMSFIPIINSNFTGKLEAGDESIFFEATGTDETSVNLACVIFAYALSERGFDIYSVDTGKNDTPNLETKEILVNPSQVKQLFGIDLKESEMKTLLEKAQYDYSNHKVKIPAYRNDILHPFDVIEDVGIMYGYNNIEDRKLDVATIGSILPINSFIGKVRELVVGLGYQETMSAVLTNKNYLYKNMNIEDFGTVEIDEFMSETYSVVRSWILPNVMEVLSKNKHVPYPHYVFEEGIVNYRKGDKVIECNKIAIALSHETANYTQIRQCLDMLARCFGLQIELKEESHGSFIEGRCAAAYAKGKQIAILGEINPKVLTNWNIEMPTSAMEINLTELFELIEKK